MELLADLTQRLLEGQDPDRDVLPALFSALSAELGVDASIGYIVAEAGERLKLAFHQGLDPESARNLVTLDYGQAVCGTVAATRQPMHVSNVQSSPLPRDSLIRSVGIRAYACEPLLVGENLLGTLSFASRRADAFEAEDIAFFRSVAHHIALARERQAAAAMARETERAQSFRLALTDRLRDATDPQAMMDAATELLGRHLGVAQIGFAEFEEDGIHIIVHRDWNDGRIPSVTGRWRLADFGDDFVRDMLAGKTIVIPDVTRDPRTNSPQGLASYEGIKTRAILDIALVREGRMRAMLFTHDPEPRAWQPHEVHLVEETVERLWAAVERARAEKAMLRQVELADLAQAAAHAAFYEYRPGGHTVLHNPTFAAVLGYGPNEIPLTIHGWWSLVHPEDLHAFSMAVGKALRRGGDFACEYRVRHKTGSWIWVSNHGRVTIDPHGRNRTGRRLVGMIIDITSRKTAELAIAAETEAMRRLQQVSTLLVSESEPELIYGHILDAAAGIMGTDCASIQVLSADGKSLELLASRGFHPATVRAWRSVATGPSTISGSALERRERVLVRDVELSHFINDAKDLATYHRSGIRAVQCTPLVTRQGKPVGLISTHWRTPHTPSERDLRLLDVIARQAADAIDRAHADAAVKEAEARFSAIAATVPAMIYIKDCESRLVYANEAYARTAGRPLSDLVGRTEADWHTIPAEAQAVLDNERRVLDAGRSQSMEEQFTSPGEEPRWWLSIKSPFADAKGQITGIVCVSMDVTSRKQIEAELERLNTTLEQRVEERSAQLRQINALLLAEMERREAAQAALIQSQKLEALGQLTAGIAHDFNNITAAIAGGFAMIERRTTDPRIAEVARHGASAAMRGGRLVKQLLAFARQQVLEPRAVNLCHLLEEAAPLIRQAVGPAVTVEVTCPPALWQVNIDPVQLESTLLNLGLNARDAMPKGGTLRIAVANCPAGQAGRPKELGETDAVVIATSDTGTGMSPDVLQRVMEPFYTTKPQGKGTGLGLPMVHGFVSQSGGALDIESREGTGTTIRLYLPRCLSNSDAATMPDTAAPRPAADDANAIAHDDAHDDAAILVVDDDEDVRAVTAATLRELGYDVQEAGGAAQALAALRRHPRCDLVLSDVVMPGCDGPTLARRLRSDRPALPVLFMTGHADRAKLAGEKVIDKPFTPAALVRAVRESLGRT